MPRYNTGAYQIRNKVNGKVYVGGAYKSFEARRRLHWRDLRLGVHRNKHLQAAWNHYGESAFVFEVLQCCRPEREVIIACEQKWLDKLRAADRRCGYNTNPTAESRLGAKLSEEARDAMRVTYAKVRNRVIATKKANPPSAEALERMGAANRGKKRGPQSPEVRAKLSKLRKEFWADPVRSKANREARGTVEARRRNSEAIKAAWANPETRKRMLAGLKNRPKKGASK